MRTRSAASGAEPAQSHVRATVTSRLRSFYRRNGYTRWPHVERREQVGRSRYRKGVELRLVANTPDELNLIRDLLLEAGFNPGRPFTKCRQYRLPVYGREAVLRFLALVGAPGTRHRRRTGG